VCSPITRHGWRPDRQGVRARVRRFWVPGERRQRGGKVIVSEIVCQMRRSTRAPARRTTRAVAALAPHHGRGPRETRAAIRGPRNRAVISGGGLWGGDNAARVRVGVAGA
jgi:hypothetical protein